jgi:hypothetical protein
MLAKDVNMTAAWATVKMEVSALCINRLRETRYLLLGRLVLIILELLKFVVLDIVHVCSHVMNSSSFVLR